MMLLLASLTPEMEFIPIQKDWSTLISGSAWSTPKSLKLFHLQGIYLAQFEPQTLIRLPLTRCAKRCLMVSPTSCNFWLYQADNCQLGRFNHRFGSSQGSVSDTTEIFVRNDVGKPFSTNVSNDKRQWFGLLKYMYMWFQPWSAKTIALHPNVWHATMTGKGFLAIMVSDWTSKLSDIRLSTTNITVIADGKSMRQALRESECISRTFW